MGLARAADAAATNAAGASHSAREDLRQNPRLLWFLVIATIPAALAGWRFEHAAEEQLRSPMIVGIALIVIALFMWAGDWLGKRERDLGHVGFSTRSWWAWRKRWR